MRRCAILAGAPELAQIAQKEGLPIHVSAMDVDSDASVTAAIRAIEKANGPLDVLVNNAGIERKGSTEELDLAEFPGRDGDKLFWGVALHQGHYAGSCAPAAAAALSMSLRLPGASPRLRWAPTRLRSLRWKG